MKTQQKLEFAATFITILGIIVTFVLGIGFNFLSDKMTVGLDFWTIIIGCALSIIAISTIIFLLIRKSDATNNYVFTLADYLYPILSNIGINLLSNTLAKMSVGDREIQESLLELVRRQATIYNELEEQNRRLLSLIQNEMPLEHLDTNDKLRIIHNINKGISLLPDVSPNLSEETSGVAQRVQKLMKSNLALNAKLEISIPIIPFLIEYKVDASQLEKLQPIKNELVKEWKILIDFANRKAANR